MLGTILIVDDERNTREGLTHTLEEKFEIFLARDAEEAFRLMDSESFDLILTDLRMAGKSGMHVIDKAITLPYKPICIMMTAYGNIETAVAAMKKGAFDFISKPINLGRLEILIKRALQTRNLEKENKALHRRLDKKYNFQNIIGKSESLKSIIEKTKQVAPSKATVLLQGETGTGKELIAQLLHQNSPRSKNPFVVIHCAALPANLLESELFGHEKGAFTGAAGRRIGRFESANNGTLFLDEIGEIDAPTQVKLLRFLETKSFERVGSSNPINVDIRLVCATNKNLEEMVKKGTFREDLFYRLNVISLNLPSLRERTTDIPILIEYYIKQFSLDNGVNPPQCNKSCMRALQKYSWPGNIRELRNFAENVVVMNPAKEIDILDLDQKFDTHNYPETQSLSVEANEKTLLQNALKKSQGNKTKAAEMLGISRRTLHRKLKQWEEATS